MVGRKPVVASMCGLLAVTLAATARADPGGHTGPRNADPAPVRAIPEARKVFHLHIRGDLDSLRMARDFADACTAARADGAELLVLELSGDRWRADVLHAMARTLRAEESPGAHGAPTRAGLRTLALLCDDADRRVGFGQASLALLADSCAVAPRTRIVFEAADDLRATAPPDTDWERVDRELQGSLYLAAKDRGADVMLAAMLPRPTGPLWAAPGEAPGSPWRLTTNIPDDPHRILIVRAADPDRPARVELDAIAARRIGIADLEAGDLGTLLGAAGLRARATTRHELVSGLAAARGRIDRLVQQLNDGLRALDADLAQAAKLRGQDAARRKRDAGQRAERPLAEAERRLLDTEAVMTDYPELLAGLPPGRTPVGQDPARHPMLWRWLFQDLRDQIAALKARAESLARTP